MAHHLTLSTSAHRRFDRLAADLRRVLGDRFVALVATGATTSVAFADRLTSGDLDALAALVDTWHREDLDTPLMMTADEFRRSLDTFSLEYQTIIDRHVVIAGTPPFAGVVLPADQLRQACEIQAKGHLIHLRQGWLEAAGHADRLATLAARSAPVLRALLSNVARLAAHGAAHGDDAALEGAAAAGLPEALICELLALEDAPDRGRAIVSRMPEYLAASERLWVFVDTWRP